MNADQNGSHSEVSAGETCPDQKKSFFRKKGFLLLLILMCSLIVIPGAAGGFLLLGKAQDYPCPSIGLHHFRAMNDLMRKYRREQRRRKRNPANSPEYITLRLNNRQLNALLEIGRVYAKPIEDFAWTAHIRKDGTVVIHFSRHLLRKIGLNGEVHIIPSFRENRFHFKATYFRLGKLVPGPGHLQKKLDEFSEKIKERQKYKQILNNVHSASFHSGDLILVLKDTSLSGIPLMGF